MHLFFFFFSTLSCEPISPKLHQPSRCFRGVSGEDKYCEKTTIVGQLDQLGASLIATTRSSDTLQALLDNRFWAFFLSMFSYF